MSASGRLACKRWSRARCSKPTSSVGLGRLSVSGLNVLEIGGAYATLHPHGFFAGGFETSDVMFWYLCGSRCLLCKSVGRKVPNIISKPYLASKDKVVVAFVFPVHPVDLADFD